MQNADHWWVFDKPRGHDPLFLTALALGVVGAVTAIWRSDRYGAGALILNIVLAVPYAILLVGIAGGSIREYLRGRKKRT